MIKYTVFIYPFLMPSKTGKPLLVQVPSLLGSWSQFYQFLPRTLISASEIYSLWQRKFIIHSVFLVTLKTVLSSTHQNVRKCYSKPSSIFSSHCILKCSSLQLKTFALRKCPENTAWTTESSLFLRKIIIIGSKVLHTSNFKKST